jgi:hypothetical protein
MRYFFHVMDGKLILDTEGTELVDFAQAKQEAITTAAEMLRTLKTASDGTPWRMVVTTDDQTIVFSLDFMGREHGLASLPK